jgi:hypothetical protein
MTCSTRFGRGSQVRSACSCTAIDRGGRDTSTSVLIQSLA